MARTGSEMVSDKLSKPLAEVRQLIQKYADDLKVSRDDAIQIIIDSIVIENNRTTSELVGGFAGVDKVQGRIILNRAHTWNEREMREMLCSGEAVSDLDANTVLIDKFARDVALSRERAEQILNIARQEAAKASPPE